jgi:hypothetical protein
MKINLAGGRETFAGSETSKLLLFFAGGDPKGHLVENCFFKVVKSLKILFLCYRCRCCCCCGSRGMKMRCT